MVLYIMCKYIHLYIIYLRVFERLFLYIDNTVLRTFFILYIYLL